MLVLLYAGCDRVLGVSMDKRHPKFPKVPTFKELGYDLFGGAYRGIAVPKSTPDNIKKQVSELIGEINRDPEFIKPSSIPWRLLLVAAPLHRLCAQHADRGRRAVRGICLRTESAAADGRPGVALNESNPEIFQFFHSLLAVFPVAE